MSQSSHADPLDARFGDAANRRKIDAAGGFKLDRGIPTIAPSDRLAEHRGRHVVQEYDVRPGGKHFVKLLEGIDFNLDDRLPAGFAKALFAIIPRTANSLGRPEAATCGIPAPSGCP